MKRYFLITTMIIAVLAAIWIIFFHKGTSGKTETERPDQRKQTAIVSVITAAPSDISETLELTGSVEPYRVAQLASPAEGPVENIIVREADSVDFNEALLSIGRKKGVDALIISLREELKKEEDNLNRVHQLVERGLLPVEQLDRARAVYEKVRASLIGAEETARDYIIKAPWAGVVSRVNVKEGEFVPPRTALLEIYDPASLVIRASIPERHAAEVTTGMHVDVQLDAYPDKVTPGRIERVYPYLDSRLRTRTVEILLNKSVKLLPGMFARLKVLLKNKDNVVTIPIEGLVSTSKGWAVFLFENGKAMARQVETGIEYGNRIEIISGIQPDDKVIVAGNEKLKDGADVRLAKDDKAIKEKNKDIAETPARQHGNTGDSQ